MIPAKLRAKHKLGAGDPVAVQEEEGRIVIIPLPKDPIAAVYGLLKGAGPLTEDLLAEHRREVRAEKLDSVRAKRRQSGRHEA